VTPLECESEDAADEDWCDASPEKPYRDERPPPLPPDELRVGHAALVCGFIGAVNPGEAGSQVSRGISA
jgi:hypothetical protein